MGIIQFWRCDYCESETTTSQPLGWRLKGELNSRAFSVAKSFDLFFCTTKCGELWFSDYKPNLLSSNASKEF